MANDLKNTQPPEEPPTAAPAGIPSQDPRLKAQEPLTPAERASEANSVVMGGGMAAGAAAGAACNAGGQTTDTQTYAIQKAPKSLCIAILPPVTLAMSSSKPLRKLC